MQKDEFLRLIINSIRNDLISRNEAFQCLALGFVGNGKPVTPSPSVFLPFRDVMQAFLFNKMLTSNVDVMQLGVRRWLHC